MPQTQATAGVVSDSIDGNATNFRKEPVVEVPNKVTNLATTSDPDKAKSVVTEDSTADDEEAPESKTPEKDIPKSLRGKSLDEVIGIYRNSQSEIGRLRNEVGQSRYMIDQLLNLRGTESPTAATSKAKQEPVTSEQLLTDPDAVISGVAERAAKKANESNDDRLARLEFEAQSNKFSSRFPKHNEIMADESFVEWVKSSPYRTRLAAQTAQQGNWDAAHELFGMYEEIENVRNATVTTNRKASDATEGSTVRPGNGNTTGGAQKATTNASRQAGKTIYKRNELSRLYITDRDAYNAIAPDIRAAYAEGRVR